MPTTLIRADAARAARERHAVSITYDTRARAHRATCSGPDCRFDKTGDYDTLVVAAAAHESRPSTS